MSLIEHKILSKVLEEEQFHVLNKYNITADDFQILGDTYTFIREYVEDFGAVPDYLTVVEKYEDFDYNAETSDTFGYLAKELKSQRVGRSAYELLMNEAGDKYSSLSGTDFVRWLADEAVTLRDIAEINTALGVDWSKNGEERAERYDKNKDPQIKTFIPTPYPTLTDYLAGGFAKSSYVTILSGTNVGKTWITTHIGVHSWKCGFNVLHYAIEEGREKQESRLDTLAGQFNNTDITRGRLADENGYKEFLQEFNEKSDKAFYRIKTMEDLRNGLTTDIIEADLAMYPETDMVIIDSFNLMIHKGRGANHELMSNTSRALRRIFARYKVVGINVHQTNRDAQKESETIDDDGNFTLNVPKLTDVGGTISISQDSVTILGFNQKEGIGKLGIVKDRGRHVGKIIELHADFDNGIIREPNPTDYF